MNSEDGQVNSVCILQFSCLTKYTLTAYIQIYINKQRALLNTGCLWKKLAF